MDFGRDYTFPLPPRGPGLGWGSCIEPQLDLKDEEGPGFWSRPVSLRAARVDATQDALRISWPDHELVTIVRLGLGATVSYE